MKYKHNVIFVPGLGDDVVLTELATRHWKNYGLEPHIHSIGWRDGENDFEIKLDRLIKKIDLLSQDGAKVSLVGCSAGGSAVLNTLIERRDKIHKVITLCSRLKTGNETGFRSFKAKTASSPTFAQSIKLLEMKYPKITINDRKKVMTVSARFGDELVPAATSIFEGALNISIPTIGHMLTIAMGLSVLSKPLKSFIYS